MVQLKELSERETMPV